MSIVPPVSPRQNQSVEYSSGGSSKLPLILLAVVMVLGMGGLFLYARNLNERLDLMQRTLETSLTNQVQQITSRMDQTDSRHAELQGQFTVTRDKLGMTQAELARAHEIAENLSREQKEAAAQLSSQLGQLQQEQAATKGNLGSLSTDVTGVKGEVKTTQEQLEATRTELKRVTGDLGVTSDLVAKNGSELEELRLRGERDYVEFDLKKSAKRQKVGNIQLELKKTDDKRQKYTINLVADDRTIEKKDRTALEPVQFYQPGQRAPTEIVVQQVYKDRITGYISAPKQAPRTSTNRQG